MGAKDVEAIAEKKYNVVGQSVLRRDGLGHLLGADRQRCRVARDEDPGHFDTSSPDAISLKRSGVTRPCSSPSTSMAGLRAQLPRQ